MANTTPELPKVLTPEETIAKLQKELAEKDDLIGELNEQSKATIAVPTVKIKGKLYKILVPSFFDGKGFVKTEDLPELILIGQIGEALIEIK